MKNYIRAMLDDLKKKKTAPRPAKVAEDLSNQELSDDPLQRTRQLDFQAQQDQERQNH